MNGTEFESEKEARCARPMATDRSGGAARQYTAPVVHVLVPIGNRPFQDASLLVGLNRLIGVPGRDVAASGLPDDRRHGRLQGLASSRSPVQRRGQALRVLRGRMRGCVKHRRAARRACEAVPFAETASQPWFRQS